MPAFNCGVQLAGYYMNKCLVLAILTGMAALYPGLVTASVVGKLMEMLKGMNDEMIEIAGQPLEDLENAGFPLHDTDVNLREFCNYYDLTLNVKTTGDDSRVVTFGKGNLHITVLYDMHHFQLEARDVNKAKRALEEVKRQSVLWFSSLVEKNRQVTNALQREYVSFQQQVEADRQVAEALQQKYDSEWLQIGRDHEFARALAREQLQIEMDREFARVLASEQLQIQRDREFAQALAREQATAA